MCGERDREAEIGKRGHKEGVILLLLLCSAMRILFLSLEKVLIEMGWWLIFSQCFPVFRLILPNSRGKVGRT